MAGVSFAFIVAAIMSDPVERKILLAAIASSTAATMVAVSIKAFLTRRTTRPTRSIAPIQLLDLLLPAKIARDSLLNLDEMMQFWIETRGKRAAAWIRRVQIARIVIGEYRTILLRTLGKLLGLFTGR